MLLDRAAELRESKDDSSSGAYAVTMSLLVVDLSQKYVAIAMKMNIIPSSISPMVTLENTIGKLQWK